MNTASQKALIITLLILPGIMFFYQNCGPANMQYAFDKKSQNFVLNADNAKFLRDKSTFPNTNSFRPNDKFTLFVTYENTGSSDWRVVDKIQLKVTDAAVWKSLAAVPIDKDVRVGERFAFKIEITAPTFAGNVCRIFPMDTQMERPGVGLFGEKANVGTTISVCPLGATPTPSSPNPPPPPPPPPPSGQPGCQDPGVCGRNGLFEGFMGGSCDDTPCGQACPKNRGVQDSDGVDECACHEDCDSPPRCGGSCRGP